VLFNRMGSSEENAQAEARATGLSYVPMILRNSMVNGS
jgi:hypothetical protein